MSNRKVEVAAGLRALTVNDGQTVMPEGKPFVVSPQEYARLAPLLADGTLIDRGTTSEKVTYVGKDDPASFEMPAFNSDMTGAHWVDLKAVDAVNVEDVLVWRDDWGALAMPVDESNAYWYGAVDPGVTFEPGKTYSVRVEWSHHREPDLQDPFYAYWCSPEHDYNAFSWMTAIWIPTITKPKGERHVDWVLITIGSGQDNWTPEEPHWMFEFSPAVRLHSLAIMEGDRTPGFTANGVPVRSDGRDIVLPRLFLDQRGPVNSVEIVDEYYLREFSVWGQPSDNPAPPIRDYNANNYAVLNRSNQPGLNGTLPNYQHDWDTATNITEWASKGSDTGDFVDPTILLPGLYRIRWAVTFESVASLADRVIYVLFRLFGYEVARTNYVVFSGNNTWTAQAEVEFFLPVGGVTWNIVAGWVGPGAKTNLAPKTERIIVDRLLGIS